MPPIAAIFACAATAAAIAALMLVVEEARKPTARIDRLPNALWTNVTIIGACVSGFFLAIFALFFGGILAAIAVIAFLAAAYALPLGKYLPGGGKDWSALYRLKLPLAAVSLLFSIYAWARALSFDQGT